MTSTMWFSAKTPEVKRVLFHTINHTGLGHMNRAINLAQWLKANIPTIQILFLIEGSEDFMAPSGFPWVMTFTHANQQEHAEQITRTLLETFRPDLVIYDTMLRQIVYQPVIQAGIKQLLVGKAENIMREQLQEKLDVIQRMDMLLIVQQRHDVELSDQTLLAQYTGPIVYAGPMLRQKLKTPPEQLRKQLGLTVEDKVLLLTLGGGGYNMANDLLLNVLALKRTILAIHPKTRLIVITGPYFGSNGGELPARDEFVCYVSRFEPYFSDYLNIASAVVGMAGYNTVNEVAACGIPTICVPTPEAGDQVGKGSMIEYAKGVPNIVVSGIALEELGPRIVAALAQERNLSVVVEFQRRVQSVSQTIVHALKKLLA